MTTPAASPRGYWQVSGKDAERLSPEKLEQMRDALIERAGDPMIVVEGITLHWREAHAGLDVEAILFRLEQDAQAAERNDPKPSMLGTSMAAAYRHVAKWLPEWAAAYGGQREEERLRGDVTLLRDLWRKQGYAIHDEMFADLRTNTGLRAARATALLDCAKMLDDVLEGREQARGQRG